MATLRIPALFSLFHHDLLRFAGAPTDLPYEWNLLPGFSLDNPRIVTVRGPFQVFWSGGRRIDGGMEFETHGESSNKPRVTILRAILRFPAGDANELIQGLNERGLKVEFDIAELPGSKYRCELQRK